MCARNLRAPSLAGSPRLACLHPATQRLALIRSPRVGPVAGKNVERIAVSLGVFVREVVGFNGELHFDTSKPDGAPRKLLDVSRLQALGWRPRIPLREGVMRSYRWFIEHQHNYRG
jgi:hypothetical protein